MTVGTRSTGQQSHDRLPRRQGFKALDQINQLMRIFVNQASGHKTIYYFMVTLLTAH
jgi:hypothetical protein